MDIASILGLVIGIAVILGSQMLESGGNISIIHPTAALIVFGGTIGAIFLSFSLTTIISSIKSLKKVFMPEQIDIKILITDMVNLTELTRREGNLSLEPIIKDIDNDFLRKGIQLVADSANPRVIKEIMNTQIDYEEESHLINARVLEAAGGFAPTFGIVGAVLGLIQVMQHIAEPAQLGQGIATAFIATVYGVGIANIVLLPLGSKIRLRAREEILVKEMIVEGVLSIHAGENPSVLEEKLNSFLTDHQRFAFSEELVENEGW
ncbi:MAG: flagellar motor protein [Vampirovibrionia bacterium]